MNSSRHSVRVFPEPHASTNNEPGADSPAVASITSVFEPLISTVAGNNFFVLKFRAPPPSDSTVTCESAAITPFLYAMVVMLAPSI